MELMAKIAARINKTGASIDCLRPFSYAKRQVSSLPFF
jgi:hypothetical protein